MMIRLILGVMVWVGMGQVVLAEDGLWNYGLAPNEVPALAQKMLETDKSKILYFKDGKLVRKEAGCEYVSSGTYSGTPSFGFCCKELSSGPPSPDCEHAKKEMLGIGDACKFKGSAPGYLYYCSR